MVLCHGQSAGAAIDPSLDETTALRAPAVVMLAGPALADVQHLIDHSWVCVGAIPLMSRPLVVDADAVDSLDTAKLTPDTAQLAPDPTKLTGGEIDAARNLIGDVFELDDDVAEVALPLGAEQRAGVSVWGRTLRDGTLVSTLVAVRVDDTVVIRSMATRPDQQRRGHGTFVLEAALVAATRSGATLALLHSSAAGEPFYTAAGFTELERWQLWSRPRWVLGRN